jgi:hypothetical protein
MARKVKKVVLNPKVPRTRNNATMTESAFFSWLRERLRKSSMYWKPINVVKKEAQVPYKGDNKRRKFSYVCDQCKGEFSDKEVVVHHKVECGSLKSFDDLSGFAERLFVEKDGLVLICKECHTKIHSK